MQKTKKASITLPKNIQLTFITAIAIGLVVNAIHLISLLIRVYPHGMRLSQFSIMAIGQILLPAILFTISFFAYKKSTTRFDHIFNATLLMIVGQSIHQVVSIIEGLLLRYQNISSSIFGVTWAPAVSMVVTLCLFALLLLALSSRDKKVNHARRLQATVLTVVALTFLVDASFNLWALISQHVGSKNILNLLTHQQLIIPIILPIAFFLAAYLLLPRVSDRLNHVFTSTIYALVGVTVAAITMLLFYIGTWALPTSDFVSLHAFGLQTVFTTVISLAVYTFLIITHNRPKKATKKTK